WTREDVAQAEPHTLKEMWALRLPLAGKDGIVGHLNLYREAGLSGLQLDVNYLCTLFHEEAIKAVERILAKPARPEEAQLARAAAAGRWPHATKHAFSGEVRYHETSEADRD